MGITTEKVQVYLADDHAVFRQSLRHLIDSAADLLIVGETGDGLVAIDEIRAQRPAAALVAVCLPGLDGLELLRRIRAAGLPTACIMLALDVDESTFNAAFDAGAAGFMTKENALDEVLPALRAVTAGEIYVDGFNRPLLARRHERIHTTGRRALGIGELTPTERLVLRLVAENKTSREIAAELFISHRTAKSHRASICRKLNLQGKASEQPDPAGPGGIP